MPDLDVSTLITVDQAISILDSTPIHPHTTTLPLLDSLNLILAADLKNDRDAPPFDKSLMDGYAVRSADTNTAPRDLAIIATIAAGGSSPSASPPARPSPS